MATGQVEPRYWMISVGCSEHVRGDGEPDSARHATVAPAPTSEGARILRNLVPSMVGAAVALVTDETR